VTPSRPNQIVYGASKSEPPRKPGNTPPLGRSIFSLVLTIGLITGLIYGFLAIWQLSSPGETTVPRITGLDLPAAQLMLRNEGLDYFVAADRASDSVGEGKVLEAQPAPGRIVKKGRRISLVVSTGTAWTNVPDIREMSERRAETVLKEKKLFLGKRSYIYHDKLPKGYIIEQVPEPATRVKRDSEVQAVVSQGPAPAEGEPDANSNNAPPPDNNGSTDAAPQ
jgi:eukaryotic-like serine/threonine-protein kinase